MGDSEMVRVEQSLTGRRRNCGDPEANRLITVYCFGDASEAEKRRVEQHLLECEQCWDEARRLDGAISLLNADRSLLELASVEEAASTFGISGRLSRLLGGHLWHAALASLIFATLHAVGLLVEVAYQYDRYRETAVWFATGLFLWILLTSLGGLIIDWKLTLKGSLKGFQVAAAVFTGATIIASIAACLYLPSVPVSDLSLQAYTAQAAFLKTALYFQIFLYVFMLPPFHFILAAQRECRGGRHKSILSLLSGERISVAPRGSTYAKFPVLVCLLVIIVGTALFLHQNLMSHLKPGEYMGLFSNLILVRLILFHLFAAECLLWYYLSLNELKRECLAVSRIRFAEGGKR